VVEFVGSFDSSNGAGGGGGKPVVVDEAKLFNDEKFGVGKPNGDIDGKPNGRPQGRSRKYIIKCKKTTLLIKRKKPYY
jgi:hypothetical protein